MWGRRATFLVAVVVLMLGAAACSSQPQVLGEREIQQEQQGLGEQQGLQERQVLVAQQRQIEQLEQQVERLEEQIAELEQEQDSGGIFGDQEGFGDDGGSFFGERDQRQVFEDQQRRLDQLERQVQEQE